MITINQKEQIEIFNQLITLSEVAFIYRIDSSTLRKKISKGILRANIDVMKFGGTWIMTKKSMVKMFGKYRYEKYLEEGRDIEYKYKMGLISLNEKTMLELEDSIFIWHFFLDLSHNMFYN